MIKEQGSDRFIPLPKKLGCGFTQVDLTSDQNQIPRLFTSVDAAKGALREWLKGYQYNQWGYDHYEGPFLKLMPDRVKENMEIVEIAIRTDI